MAGIKTLITYPKSANFKADYYTATHLPLVKKTWGPSGFISAELLDHSKDDSSPFSYSLIITWKDENSPRAAFADPATKQVIDDIPNFSSEKPTIFSGAVVHQV
ncbi:EthD domain [Geosmithia morbida]|uniref:EthD domain n=1 Tax=Geosmithia morbida TaxID=1094350 RepID=A0A9P4YPQ6_9HYPO|nr:EthD domain [Geosmithia morbida]KAF4120465.1 EthD domain [Geosmithia morbida]